MDYNHVTSRGGKTDHAKSCERFPPRKILSWKGHFSFRVFVLGIERNDTFSHFIHSPVSRTRTDESFVSVFILFARCRGRILNPSRLNLKLYEISKRFWKTPGLDSSGALTSRSLGLIFSISCSEISNYCTLSCKPWKVTSTVWPKLWIWGLVEARKCLDKNSRNIHGTKVSFYSWTSSCV